MLHRLKNDAHGLAALDDDLRRQMYLEVRAQRRPVSREEVADAVGVSRKLAAFHLDKLVDRGLLVASYARPSERRGPGAGRSAKYYEPSDQEFDVSIPERTYDVMGSILLSAVETQSLGESAAEAARRAARSYGEQLGRDVREERHLQPPGAERTLSIATDVLSTCGYEPFTEDGAIRFNNCPFHVLADQNRELVCSLNRELVQGIVTGLGNRSLPVTLAPVPNGCCVRLGPAESSA
jgi:predicted ArsR family transcriptional regulator